MSQTVILRDERNRAFALDFIAKLSLVKPWQIEIKPFAKKRSLPQNALLHKWLEIIANDTGNEMDEVKEILKRRFLPPVFIELAGETIETRRSTAKLTVLEMTMFLERVLAFAASDLGIILPVPEEMHMRERAA